MTTSEKLLALFRGAAGGTWLASTILVVSMIFTGSPPIGSPLGYSGLGAMWTSMGLLMLDHYFILSPGTPYRAKRMIMAGIVGLFGGAFFFLLAFLNA